MDKQKRQKPFGRFYNVLEEWANVSLTSCIILSAHHQDLSSLCELCSLSLAHGFKAKACKWISLMLISKHFRKKLITIISWKIFNCCYFSSIRGNLDSFSIFLQTTQRVTRRTALTFVFSGGSETFDRTFTGTGNMSNPNKQTSTNSKKQSYFYHLLHLCSALSLLRVSKIEISYFKPFEAVTVYSTRLLSIIWGKWYHAQKNCGHIFLPHHQPRRPIWGRKHELERKMIQIHTRNEASLS